MDKDQSLDINNIGQKDRYQGNNNQEEGRFTLDESKITTIKRDLMNVYNKAKISLLPMVSKDLKALQDWDFWGPLLLCLILGLVLSWQREDEHSGIVFILIFTIVFFGGLIVSLNARFLGVGLNAFQCICILGYCMVAIVIAACCNLILGFLPIFFHILISLAGWLYSTYGKFYFFISIKIFFFSNYSRFNFC